MNVLGLDSSTGFYGVLILLLPLEATEEDSEDKGATMRLV